MSQPRTSGASRAGARPRGLLDSLLCRQLGNVHGAPLPNSGSRARNPLTPPLVAAVSPRALLEDLTCDSARDVHGFASGGRGVPPFSVRYCPDAGRGHVLAVADESGRVSMIDTRHGVAEQRADDGFPAHHNALFDLAWVAGERRLVTGSGDQTCKLFDVETKLELSSYHAHRGSVKSVSVRPGAPHLFASGARDGDIHVWDVRAGTAPVVTVLNAHYSPDAAGGKRKRTAGVSSTQSVSAVAYLPDTGAGTLLASAGATDGTVKLWDLRTTAGGRGGGKAREKKPAAVHELRPQASGGGRAHGVTSLAVDAAGGRLLASSTDNSIYLYDVVRPSRGEVGRLRGHMTDTFYVKATFSPDGRFVASGSSDFRLYVWELGRVDPMPLCVRGHRSEVSGVAWSANDWCEIATCSDDCTVRVWRVDRDSPRRSLASPALAHTDAPADDADEELEAFAAAMPMAPPPPRSPAAAAATSGGPSPRRRAISDYLVPATPADAPAAPAAETPAEAAGAQAAAADTPATAPAPAPVSASAASASASASAAGPSSEGARRSGTLRDFFSGVD